MSQRITKVRKKTASGFGDPIPIGAEAQNVTMSDGTVVEDIINQLRANSEMGHQVLTQSEYSALSTTVQNNGTIYFISDGFGDGTTHAANIQYNHNASQLNANDVQSAIDEIKNFQDFKTKMHIYFDYENGGDTLTSIRAAIGTGLISFYNDLKSYYGNSSAYVQETFFVRIKTSLCDCDCLVTADTLVSFSYIANTQDYGLVSGGGWINDTANPLTYEEVRFERVVSYDTSNNVIIKDGGGVYVGTNKTAQYTQPGVMLHPQGYVCLTNSTTVGSRGGIYFAYNNASNPTSYMKEFMQGYLQIGNNLRVPNAILVGSTKTDYYTQQGVGLASNGNITLTGAASGNGAGLYFARNGSNAYSAGIWLNSDNNITINKWLLINAINGVQGYAINSDTTSTRRVASLACNTATQLEIKGQWMASTYKSMYVSVSSSDPRLKENIKPSTLNAIKLLNKLPIYEFDWKADKKHWDAGFLATEVYEIEPELCIKPDDEEEGYWGMNDHYFIAVHTKAIQELSKENKQLKSQIQDLKQEINELKQNLIRLENLIIQNK